MVKIYLNNFIVAHNMHKQNEPIHIVFFMSGEMHREKWIGMYINDVLNPPFPILLLIYFVKD